MSGHASRSELQPGVATVVSRWPIRTLWEARGDAGTGRCDAADGNGESVLVYRRDTVVRLDLTDKAEVSALRAVARASPLAAVLEHAVGRGVPAVEAAGLAGALAAGSVCSRVGNGGRSVRGRSARITTGFILRCREAPRSPRGLL